jgi:hypothetical protein
MIGSGSHIGAYIVVLHTDWHYTIAKCIPQFGGGAEFGDHKIQSKYTYNDLIVSCLTVHCVAEVKINSSMVKTL